MADATPAMPRTVVVEVSSETSMTGVVRAVLRSLADAARDVRLTARELDELAVVLQEACTNVIRHAHHLDATVRYRVEFRRLESALEILVIDHGAPFTLPGVPLAPEDADAAIDAAIDNEATAELMREGGYGVQIMRTWTDELSVTHNGEGNVLRILRRYRTPAPREKESLASRA